MGMTVTEKILARASGRDKVSPGEFLDCKVDLISTMDLQGNLVLNTLKKLGVSKVRSPEKVAIILDHQSPSHSVAMADIHKNIRTTAHELGITNLYDVGTGIMHVILPEKGHILPGELVVMNESHTPTAGAMGAAVMGVGQTDAAAVMALGEIWMMVPETIRINLVGELQKGVTTKDVALKLMSIFRYEEKAVYKTIEIGGPGLRTISMDGRFTLTNFCSDMGAKSAIIEPDEITLEYLQGRALRDYTPYYSDPDCTYSETYEINLNELEPLVACPHALDNVHPVTSVAGTKINQAHLGTCTNGRLEDIKAAAEIMKNQRVALGVRFLVVPGSKEVYKKAMKLGYLEILSDAGAVIMSPGCGPCAGDHSGVLAADEICISSGNRNWKGRMGSKDSFVYLGSPETVAASAIHGVITDPRDFY
ncbi:3-isopropylmalate dehydratase large subunit [Neobacillus sp. 114]|uniref:3-isopropylmalate dehydratase large subunit n=1 Tax=Neobacillus sp. 114 TaxID=3048535 RepID=UPI0024C3B43B|nr:3-isopropylmalate dehydratase large subunit [Neobacillus sp. 114]